jgi:hypothetical protein
MALPWLANIPQPVQRATLAGPTQSFFYQVTLSDFPPFPCPAPKYLAVACKPDPSGGTTNFTYQVGTPFDTAAAAMAACETDYATYGSSLPPGVGP